MEKISTPVQKTLLLVLSFLVTCIGLSVQSSAPVSSYFFNIMFVLGSVKWQIEKIKSKFIKE
jgi:hypothetical protein